MNVRNKLKLTRVFESYWDMLPPELQEMILKFKQSQELIEWRESPDCRELCHDIRSYGQLRRQWFIGPIQCKSYRSKECKHRPQCTYMTIYAHYWDLNGCRRSVMLGFFFENAIETCVHVKTGLFFQLDRDHTLSVLSV